MKQITSRIKQAAKRLRKADTKQELDWAALQEDFDVLTRLLREAGHSQPADRACRASVLVAAYCETASPDPAQSDAVIQSALETIDHLEQLLKQAEQPAATAKRPKGAPRKNAKADTPSGAKAQKTKKTPPKEEAAADSAQPAALQPNEPKEPKELPPAPPLDADSIIDPGLLQDFLREACEHVEAAEQDLLSLETDSGNADALNSIFRAFHTIKGVAGFIGLGTLAAVAHEAESVLDLAREGKLTLTGPAVDAIFTAIDTIKRLLGIVQEEGVAGDGAYAQRVVGLTDLLRKIAQGDWHAAEAAAQPAQATLQPGQDEPQSEASLTTTAHQAETLRVDRARLDSLVDMIGELVIAESMVQQDLLRSGNQQAHVGRNLAQLNKITRNLQELSLSLRMVPIRATFQKMARLVRDLSKRMNKPVDFQMSGEDTELDKTVVDELSDPLMHMIRNAVDHGIEACSADRVAAGKEPRGKVTLKAYHQGGSIYVEIRDDGRGINLERLQAKAIQ